MSVIINFDHDWSCCHYGLPDTDEQFASTAVSDSAWSAVDLPHTSIAERETSTSKNWWYRKEFEWMLSHQRLTQSVCLTFNQPTGNAIAPSVHIIVWFNAVRIFSDSLHVPQTSIELPQRLMHSDPVRSHKHTLIVCCMKTSLTFHAHLTVAYDTDHVAEDPERHHSGHDYVGSIDESAPGPLRDLLVPRLTIVMLIVGTRGDVQPFIA